MIYSKNTLDKINDISKHPPQLLILVATHGSAKETILETIAQNITSITNIINIKPLEGKKTIGINQLREIKNSSFLTKRDPVVIIIPDAELLTIEAQNSMLKLLEDTPRNLHIFMSISAENKILNTIRSRAHYWRLVNPSEREIIDYYSHEDIKLIEQAMMVTGKKTRYLDEYIKGENRQSNIELAKEILSEKKFERLQRINFLTKDTKLIYELIESIIIICKAAIKMSANQNNIQKVSPWNARLDECLKAVSLLDSSVQPKLVLTRLFMVL